MTKKFSPLKALKVGLTSLALAGSCLMANSVSAFVHTQGTQIVDSNNQPIFFNGTNLGNWLLWEGYMMMGNDGYKTHTQFFWGLETAFGTQKALEFERTWRENYVTEATIEELRGLGYNSVRVPFKWSLLWNGSSLNAEGIRYIDNLISWCKPRGIKILLDMHGLPGYQNPGDHSDNLDSKAPKDEYQYTVRFLEQNNYTVAGDAWRAIAAKYANEPTIWGYDIMNEPKTAANSQGLLAVQKDIIKKIRQVDPNHIVVVEGDHWASYMDMYNVSSSGWNGSLLDPKSNVVLETHHYIWGDLAQLGELDKRAQIARNMNVPIILGEIGEDTEPVLRQLALRAKEQRYSGVYTWSFKKLFQKYRSLWVINPIQGRSGADDAYLELRNAIAQNRAFNGSWPNLITFLTSNIRNGHKDLEWWQLFHDSTGGALKDATPTPICVRSAFKPLSIPGTVQAEDFDNGCNNDAYRDGTSGNAGGSNTYRNTDVDIGTTTDGGANGYYVGWTESNEWVEYTVNVANAGNYTFDLRYAAPYDGASITVSSGSSSAKVSLPRTGDWNTWFTAKSGQVFLAGGPQKIRVNFDTGAVNLNSFAAVSNTGAISGTYAIISKASKMALEVQAGGNFNQAKVQQWTYYGLPHQKWRITRDGDDYKIIDFNSGKALDVIANDQANQAKLQIWDYVGVPNQKWKIDYNAARNAYSIKSVATNKGLDVPDGMKVNGLLVQMWDFYPNNINQEWELSPQ